MDNSMNKALLLRGMAKGEVAKSCNLTGHDAFVQITYEFVKLGEVCHDMSIGARDLAVHPEERSPIPDWSDAKSLSELLIGRDGGDLAVKFYSLNDENPALTMDSQIFSAKAPIRVKGKRVIDADGAVLAHFTRHGYWRRGEESFSDILFTPVTESGQ